MKPENASEIEYTLAEAAGQKVLFTPLRVDRDFVPPGLFCYDLRHGDDEGVACTIENHVAVNFFGTILCDRAFDFGGMDYRELEDGIDFLSIPETTLQEYQEKGALRLIVEYGMESGSEKFSRVDLEADDGKHLRLFLANAVENENDLRGCREAEGFLSELPPGTDVAAHIGTYVFGSGEEAYANEDEMEYVRTHFDEMEKGQEVACVGESDFELSNVNNKALRVLLVEPGAPPRATVIPHNLDGLQAAVGGMIEIVDLDEKTCLVCNEEGKLLGLPGNRRVGNDIIAGTFFLCGMDDDGNTVSLSEEQIEQYSKRFQEPEHYTDKQVQDALYFSFESYDNPEDFMEHLAGKEKDEDDLER